MRRPQFSFTRDVAMFAVGAFVVVNEAVSGQDRPNVLFAGVALMAGAAYLHGVRNGKNGK